MPGVHYEYTYYLMYTRPATSSGPTPSCARSSSTPTAVQGRRVAALHDDVAVALMPSAARAMALNKAYRTIVQDQDFIEAGRPSSGRPQVLSEIEQAGQRAWRRRPGSPELRWLWTGHRGRPARSRPSTASPERHGVGMGGPTARTTRSTGKASSAGADIPGNRGRDLHLSPRLTLPTREILALQNIPVCYDCHRVWSPIVDEHRRTTLELDYPATTPTPEESAVLTQLTLNPRTKSGPGGAQTARRSRSYPTGAAAARSG